MYSDSKFHSQKKPGRLAPWVIKKTETVLQATDDHLEDLVYLLAGSLYGETWLDTDQSVEIQKETVCVLADYTESHSDHKSSIIKGLMAYAFSADVAPEVSKFCEKIADNIDPNETLAYIQNELTSPNPDKRIFQRALVHFFRRTKESTSHTPYGDLAAEIILQNPQYLTDAQIKKLMEKVIEPAFRYRGARLGRVGREMVKSPTLSPAAPYMDLAYKWLFLGGVTPDEHFKICTGFIKGKKKVAGIPFSAAAAREVVGTTWHLHGDTKYYPQMVALLGQTFSFARRYDCLDSALGTLRSATSKYEIDSFLKGNDHVYGRQGIPPPQNVKRLARYFRAATKSNDIPPKPRKLCQAAAEYLDASLKLKGLNCALGS